MGADGDTMADVVVDARDDKGEADGLSDVCPRTTDWDDTGVGVVGDAAAANAAAASLAREIRGIFSTETRCTVDPRHRVIRTESNGVKPRVLKNRSISWTGICNWYTTRRIPIGQRTTFGVVIVTVAADAVEVWSVDRDETTSATDDVSMTDTGSSDGK